MGEAGTLRDGARRGGGGALGTRGHRAAPVGSFLAARVGSLRGSAATAPLPLLPVVPLCGLFDPFSYPFPFSSLASSQLSLSFVSFCPPFLPPSSLLCPPFQVPRLILPSLRLPPARFSSLQLAPAFSTSILAPSCHLSGFSQQEMKGTSWEMGGMGKVGEQCIDY